MYINKLLRGGWFGAIISCQINFKKKKREREMIDDKAVGQISYLARIKMGAEETKQMATDLSGIMEMVGQLNELNTDSVEPMVTPVDYTAPLRHDEITDGGIQSQVLANAKEVINNHYTVPKVVE